MPIPLVLKLQVHWHQKLALQLIFLLGTSLLIVPDYTSPVFFWTNIEISLGVITACTPTYRPLWLYWKGRRTTAMKASKQQSFSIFGFPHFRAFRFHGGASLSEEDNAQLNRDASVNTFIETGNPDSRDHLDIGSISVKHDIHTNSSMQPFDRIL
ncbi:MAG: hypothetical protein L6R42_000910 [Xanthoria sp. 1 TBL-2021]|nr:MAG: hypothetical protein L6R42_000910 [Xanthoria sp. 1 TBL-2021]